MFTIKFYSATGGRQVIHAAESFTILRRPDIAEPELRQSWNGTEAEITVHQKNGEGLRIDIGDDNVAPLTLYHPPRYQKAIIENAAGRTTEIIAYSSL